MTQLPIEEQNVLNVLLAAKGHPLRIVLIARECGIQDNHCNKLVKYLRDKGYWIQNDYCVVDGKKKRYKKHWIDPAQIIKPVETVEVNKKLCYESSICPHCNKSWYTKYGKCNKCGKER